MPQLPSTGALMVRKVSLSQPLSAVCPQTAAAAVLPSGKESKPHSNSHPKRFAPETSSARPSTPLWRGNRPSLQHPLHGPGLTLSIQCRGMLCIHHTSPGMPSWRHLPGQAPRPYEVWLSPGTSSWRAVAGPAWNSSRSAAQARFASSRALRRPSNASLALRPESLLQALSLDLHL